MLTVSFAGSASSQPVTASRIAAKAANTRAVFMRQCCHPALPGVKERFVGCRSVGVVLV
jgi:hypothetical protein